MFEGFDLDFSALSEATLRVRHGGTGEPLLLLHGHPALTRPGIGSRRCWRQSSMSSVRICAASDNPRGLRIWTAMPAHRSVRRRKTAWS